MDAVVLHLPAWEQPCEGKVPYLQNVPNLHLTLKSRGDMFAQMITETPPDVGPIRPVIPAPCLTNFWTRIE